MKNITFIFPLILFLLLGHTRLAAQSFAVTSNVQVTSFTPYLADYSETNSMFVTLLSTDKRPVYPVLVKLEISGQGYLIKCQTGLAGGKYLELYKNQPVTLTGIDLLELIDPDKLDFSGISRQDFIAQGGKLPEGPVVISITAFDAVLDKAVSNKASVTGSIQLNPPPLILSPLGEQMVVSPQNLLIRWSPQHSGAFAVAYDMEIYEKNTDFSYDIIVNSSAPVFSSTTFQTIYQYTDLDPQLTEGQEYLIRVRARDVAESEAFENGGWSEIEYFSYGTPGIAGCYQWEATFCTEFCDFEYGTLVCEKASYNLQVPPGGSPELSLNNLGIGDFTVTEIVSATDDYGYCSVHIVVTAENVSDVPLSLVVISSAFSDHCLSPEQAGPSPQPGFYGQGSPSPNNIGQQLSFDFWVCPDQSPVSKCDPPENSSLSVVADYPVMAQMFWGDIAGQVNTGFQIEYHLLNDPEWKLVDEIPADSLNGYIGDLEGGLVYEARVRALCAPEMVSDWSAAIEFNTSCIIPNAVWVADQDEKSARIEWAALSYATTYELKYRSVGSNKWLSVSTTEAFVVLSGLTPNTTYEYKLRVLCTAEWGGFTPVYEFTTDRLCEGNTITGQTVSDITYHSANLDWQDSAGNDTDQYSIRYRAVGEAIWQVAFIQATESGLDFLESNTWYQYNISKHCVDVWSDWSPTGSFLTDCAPPASIWADHITPNNAVLNCTPDIGIRYEFAYRQRFTETWLVKGMESAERSLSGLLDDTEYEFRVRVKCDETSEWSAFTEVSFFHTEISCDSPANYQLTEVTPFSARLEWEAAERPLKWGLYYRRTDGTPVIAEQIEGGTVGKIASTITTDGWVYQVCLDPELLIEGLVPDKWYDFKIESWCQGFGWTTDDEIQQFLTRANCKVPQGISATFVGTDTASIAWDARFNDQTYGIELRKKGSSSWETFSSLSPGYDFSHLASNVTYEYRVRTACDNFGWTDWSEIYEFRTDECISPLQVTKEYMSSNASIIISWQASAGENHYQVEYRLQDTLHPPAWAVIETGNDYSEITDLQTNKIYEYRVAENCLSAGLLYNEDQDTFLLGRNSLNNEYFECGLPVNIFDPENFYPLDYLHAGDSITAGDFRVLVTQVSGQIGKFTGRGYIPVPYFNRARVNVKFNNIKVNNEYRVVDGKVVVTGVGLQAISEETAALLGDIVDGLEGLDDLLAEAEGILEIIDEIIATLGPYLPQEVIQQLENAQTALTTAQATGNPEDITAAQAALATANQNFQAAMTELLARVLNIIIESLNQLDQEFSLQSNQIIADYESATGNLHDFDVQYNGIYATTSETPEGEPVGFEEIEWEEVDLTDQMETIGTNSEVMQSMIDLSGDYYEKVFAYGQMKGVQDLKSEIQTNADLIPFLAALMNKEVDLLDYIGSQVAQGKTNEEIIPTVKSSILTGIDKILRNL